MSLEGNSLTCAHQNDSLAPKFMYTYLHVQKQPFRLGLGDLGWRGLGDKETWCRYQSVHKQPFRLGLGDFGLGGDLGTRRHGVGIKLYINNLLGWDLGTRRQGVGIKVYINNLLGWGLGTLG